jgi:agmatinase
LGINLSLNTYENAKFVVIPVPYEVTVSYGKGTNKGPAAILEASTQVETFDQEFLADPSKKYGIYTAKPVKRADFGLYPLVKEVLVDGKIPVILGGEHSLTTYSVQAVASEVKDLSVLHIDAHADLRDSYEGKKTSHACVVRRILESGTPCVQVGVRNIAESEYLFAQKSGQLKKIFFAADLARLRTESERKKTIKKIIGLLSKNVYITFDVDGLDPSLIPATGTPEPGGLHWNDLMDLTREVAKQRKIVGFDVVELAPIKNFHSSDFAAAKFAYKLMNFICFSS